MKLQAFDGGMSTRLAPQLINTNQGVDVQNVDVSKGVLAPLRASVITEGEAPFIYYHAKTHTQYSYNKLMDFVEYQGRVYLSDRESALTVIEDDGTTRTMGIAPPTTKPTIAKSGYVAPLNSARVYRPATAGDLPYGKYTYLLVRNSSGFLSTPLFVTISLGDNTSVISTSIAAYTSINKYGFSAISTTETSTGSIALDTFVPAAATLDPVYVYRWYGDTWRRVGVVTTITTLTDSTYDISSRSSIDTMLNSTLSGGGSFSKFDGTYQYVYTYYNSNEGLESAPSPVSSELTTDYHSILVNGLQPTTDTQVTHYRLYRVGNDITQFTLAAELAAGTTGIYDYKGDDELTLQLDSDNYYAPIAGTKYLVESFGMLFGVVDSTLQFTPIAEPEAWPPEYSLSFDDALTGLGVAANGLLVFTLHKTYLVTGSGPLALSKYLLDGSKGCTSHDSIAQMTNGSLIWASLEGIETYSGSLVQSVTEASLGTLNLTPKAATTHNSTYYLLSDDKLLVFDYRYSGSIYYVVDGTDLEFITTINNELLLTDSNSNIRNLFKGSSYLSYIYKSPRFLDGSFSETKTYKKVYIRHEGDIIFKVIIDDTMITQYMLTGNKTSEIQVPNAKQRGYSIQFSIEGTGIVHEIDYVAGGRMND
jgi:hypothetical protein